MNSRAILKLNPKLTRLPLSIQRFDDPFLPFVKPIIDATQDNVVAYWLDLASYLTLGAAGARALERTLGYIGVDVPKILHAPFVGQAYSSVVDKIAFDADALTLARDEDLPHYLNHSPYAAFVVRKHVVDVPPIGGIYTDDETQLAYYDVNQSLQTFFITGDDVLFASVNDDYAQQTRTQLLAKMWSY